jgi:carboxymethylenebutenolidase
MAMDKPAMSEKIELTAADGHKLSAMRAVPTGRAKGGIVVLHAVYGVTDRIGEVCARWAEAGYTAIAPALFDRVGPNIVHPYNNPNAGTDTYNKLTPEQIMMDIRAAAASAGPEDRVAISGFCTGGSWAWRAGAATPFRAQVNFYGSHIPSLNDLSPKCPTILHYGDKDPIVPMVEVEKIRARHPDVELHVYPGAGHAFENPDQASYNKASGDLAWSRSIAFMDRLFA